MHGRTLSDLGRSVDPENVEDETDASNVVVRTGPFDDINDTFACSYSAFFQFIKAPL